MTEQRLLALIEQIYEAATDPARMADLGNVIAPHFGTDSSLIFTVRICSTHRFVPQLAGLLSATSDMLAWGGSAYRDHYHDRNEWFSRGHTKGLPAIVIGQELIDDASFSRTEFCADWCGKLNIFHVLGAQFQINSELVGAIGFHRSRSAKHFGENDRQTLGTILPHLQRALQIQHRMQTLTCERTLALDVIDGLALGLIVVGRGNRIIFANKVAERVLQNEAGISVSHGRLRLQDTTQSSLFDRVLGEAMETSTGRVTGAGGIIAANTASGRPLPLLVSPLRNAQEGYGPAQSAAIVIFSDPDAAVHSSERVLAEVYGLTPAEGRLLSGLLSGQKLTDYAEAAGISVNTAKTQMQHIFHKTGHNRQVDLIRAILSNPAIQLIGRNGPGQANGRL